MTAKTFKKLQKEIASTFPESERLSIARAILKKAHIAIPKDVVLAKDWEIATLLRGRRVSK